MRDLPLDYPGHFDAFRDEFTVWDEHGRESPPGNPSPAVEFRGVTQVTESLAGEIRMSRWPVVLVVRAGSLGTWRGFADDSGAADAVLVDGLTPGEVADVARAAAQSTPPVQRVSVVLGGLASDTARLEPLLKQAGVRVLAGVPFEVRGDVVLLDIDSLEVSATDLQTAVGMRLRSLEGMPLLLGSRFGEGENRNRLTKPFTDRQFLIALGITAGAWHQTRHRTHFPTADREGSTKTGSPVVGAQIRARTIEALTLVRDDLLNQELSPLEMLVITDVVVPSLNRAIAALQLEPLLVSEALTLEQRTLIVGEISTLDRVARVFRSLPYLASLAELVDKAVAVIRSLGL